MFAKIYLLTHSIIFSLVVLYIIFFFWFAKHFDMQGKCYTVLSGESASPFLSAPPPTHVFCLSQITETFKK